MKYLISMTIIGVFYQLENIYGILNKITRKQLSYNIILKGQSLRRAFYSNVQDRLITKTYTTKFNLKMIQIS